MAQNTAQLSVKLVPLLLWQTSTGVPPDPKTALAGGTAQVFRAGTTSDPVPIVIRNADDTNSVWLGGSGVTDATGIELVAGASITRNVIGNDSEYAISAQGGGVTVAVEVGRQ